MSKLKLELLTVYFPTFWDDIIEAGGLQAEGSKKNKIGSKKNMRSKKINPDQKKIKSDQKKINLEHPSISCETSSKFHERNLQNKHFVRDFLQISQKTKANTLHVLFSFSVFFLVLMFFVSSYCSWKRCGGERSHP